MLPRGDAYDEKALPLPEAVMVQETRGNEISGVSYYGIVGTVKNIVVVPAGLCRRKLAYTVFYRGEGNGNPLRYSCLGNPIHRGAWWDMVHGVPKS